MGLSELLGRYAACRAHVLVVEAPGAWVTRAKVERAMLDRGWRMALSPADADVLAVCGVPGPQLSEVIERLWEQMPGPRVRIDVVDAAQAREMLDTAATDLVDTRRQRQDARSRLSEPAIESDSGDERADMDHGDMDHGDMDHGDMDHGDMDHGDMEMAPDGIPLAEGDDDRDGLEMDVLHLRLGPVLTHWPAGLVLQCTLQGDVITQAQGSLIDTGNSCDSTHDADAQPLAWRNDNIARLLALAGWEDAAAAAREIRDARLRDARRPPDAPLSTGPASTRASQTRSSTDIGATADRLRKQVTRSRALRWSLRGVRPMTLADLRGQHLPEHLAGDTYDRLLTMLDHATGTSDFPIGADTLNRATTPWTAEVNLEAVARTVVGLDLATARLVIASLDLPPGPSPKPARHHHHPAAS